MSEWVNRWKDFEGGFPWKISIDLGQPLWRGVGGLKLCVEFYEWVLLLEFLIWSLMTVICSLFIKEVYSNESGDRTWSGHVNSLDANEVEVLALLTGSHELFRLIIMLFLKVILFQFFSGLRGRLLIYGNWRTRWRRCRTFLDSWGLSSYSSWSKCYRRWSC